MTLIAPKHYATINDLNLTGRVLIIQTDGKKGALILDETTGTGSSGFWRVGASHRFDHIILRVGENRNYRLIQATHSRTERLDGRKANGNSKVVHFENFRYIGVTTTESPSEFAGAKTSYGFVSVDCLPKHEPIPVFSESPEPKRQGTEVIIETRPDQPDFAADVWENCKRRCVISDVKMRARLQAAHLISHADQGPDHYSNGLILRSDLHGLFDTDHLAIEPSTLTVRISPAALATDPDLAKFADKPLLNIHHPVDPFFLELRWKKFLSLHH